MEAEAEAEAVEAVLKSTASTSLDVILIGLYSVHVYTNWARHIIQIRWIRFYIKLAFFSSQVYISTRASGA